MLEEGGAGLGVIFLCGVCGEKFSGDRDEGRGLGILFLYGICVENFFVSHFWQHLVVYRKYLQRKRRSRVPHLLSIKDVLRLTLL